MSTGKNIALIIGSLRNDSINRKFAEYIVAQFPSGISVEEIIIADLPLYNQDYDNESIAIYDKVRQQLKAVDGVLIVSPEHNRTMPSALKNVIDIASRPYGESVWSEKKMAIVTASLSHFGGINSGLDIRKSLQALSANVMRKPKVYLSRASESLDDEGVYNERTQQFLQNFAVKFIKFVRSTDI